MVIMRKREKKLRDFINNGEKPQNGLILADGMPYASFVESKGFNVLVVPPYMLRRNLMIN